MSLFEQRPSEIHLQLVHNITGSKQEDNAKRRLVSFLRQLNPMGDLIYHMKSEIRRRIILTDDGVIIEEERKHMPSTMEFPSTLKASLPKLVRNG